MIRTLKEERDKLLALLNGQMPVGDFNPSGLVAMMFDESTLEKLKQKKEEELRAQLEAKQVVESVNNYIFKNLLFSGKGENEK